MGLVDRQHAADKDREVIVIGSQVARAGSDRPGPHVFGRGGCPAETGSTIQANPAQRITIQKPAITGRESSESLAIVSLALRLGGHSQVGLANRYSLRCAGTGSKTSIAAVDRRDTMTSRVQQAVRQRGCSIDQRDNATDVCSVNLELNRATRHSIDGHTRADSGRERERLAVSCRCCCCHASGAGTARQGCKHHIIAGTTVVADAEGLPAYGIGIRGPFGQARKVADYSIGTIIINNCVCGTNRRGCT